MKIARSLFLLFLFTGCFLADDLPPDQQTWDYAAPSTTGLSDFTLLQIDNSISNKDFQEIRSLIIIKDDKLVFENYYDSVSRHTPIPLDRASIVMTVAAIGVAIDQGLLGLTDPISEHLPGYSSIFADDTLKQQITIEHLLTHRSGFSWNETLTVFFLFNPDNDLSKMLASQDWIEFILNQPLEAAPGLRYNFNSGTGTILTKIIENASATSYDQFLKENILDVVDISSMNITQDPAGNFDGGRGTTISLIDWTKFAYLMVREGIWEGRRVIDPNFVSDATSVQVAVSPFFDLGFGWQLFGSVQEGSFPPLSVEDIYYVPGEIGQYLFIIPSRNMIVSIYAENFFGSGFESVNLFRQIATAIL